MSILQILGIRPKTTDAIELGTKNRSFWWRVVADNGQILCHSENYRRRIDRDTVAKNFSARNDIPIHPLEVKGAAEAKRK